MGCWSDHERCHKRDQNHGRVKQQEGYPCQGTANHPVSSGDCLLATTYMLWLKISLKARFQPILPSLAVYERQLANCKRWCDIITCNNLLCSYLHFFCGSVADELLENHIESNSIQHTQYLQKKWWSEYSCLRWGFHELHVLEQVFNFIRYKACSWWWWCCWRYLVWPD